MSNNKKSSIEWYSNEIGKITALALSGKMTGLEWKYLQAKALEQAKAMHKEDVKSAYVSGYLDNGYYEGAEEDAAKLWEDTYGFVHNEKFNNHETK